MSAQFECWQDKAGKYRFRLTVDGQAVATSQAYKEYKAMLDDIATVRRIAPTATTVEVDS